MLQLIKDYNISENVLNENVKSKWDFILILSDFLLSVPCQIFFFFFCVVCKI